MNAAVRVAVVISYHKPETYNNYIIAINENPQQNAVKRVMRRII